MSAVKCFGVFAVLIALAAYGLYTPLPSCLDDFPISTRVSLQASPIVDVLGRVLVSLGISTMNDIMRETMKNLPVGKDSESLKSFDTQFDGVPVRVYSPEKRQPKSAALVYAHGGGWAVGSINMTDILTRVLAEKLNLLVVSVEYRLAPESPYPAPIDDVEKAFRYLFNHAADFNIDATRIAAAGDSAGGNLVASLSTRLRDAALRAQKQKSSELQPQVKFQILLYPVLQVINTSTVSMLRNRNDFILKRHEVVHFILQYALGMQYNNLTLRTLAEQYVNQACYRLKHSDVDKVYINSKNQDIRELITSEEDRKFIASFSETDEGRQVLTTTKKCTIESQAVLDELDSRLACLLQSDLSPLLSKSLAGMPTTFIVSCGYDTLRDDSFLYVERLRDAGVLVEHDYQASRCHGYYFIEPERHIGPLVAFLEKNNKVL